jgi:hypothetical protein
LLILDKALTFISDELDIFRMASRYDNRRVCIAPYNSKMQLEYAMTTCIQEVLGTREGREVTAPGQRRGAFLLPDSTTNGI